MYIVYIVYIYIYYINIVYRYLILVLYPIKIFLRALDSRQLKTKETNQPPRPRHIHGMLGDP